MSVMKIFQQLSCPPFECSRPDIVLIENARCDFGVMPLHYRRVPRITVHVVEEGYTSEFLLHDRRQIKLEQHSDLRRNLLAFGWACRSHAK